MSPTARSLSLLRRDGWTPQQIGELTWYQMQTYLADDDEFKTTVRMSAQEYRQLKRAKTTTQGD